MILIFDGTTPDSEYYDSLEQMLRGAEDHEDPRDDLTDRARETGNAGSDHEVPGHGV